MQNALTAVKLMTTYCYMASIDPTDAHYSFYMASQTSEYCKFEWHGQAYKIVGMPNGLPLGLVGLPSS